MIDNNLKDCREDLDMTQEEVGSIFGVKRKTVACWENNHRIIPFNKLIKFCDLYNYSLDYVIGFLRRNIRYGKIETNKNMIGKKLKEIRKDLNITQNTLSKKCCISQSTYSAYENGKNLISTITIYTICITYNISMDYIVGRTNKKNIK